ncbi:MAG: hypothetical protein K8T25_21265 [Planctomycetia bacterium]|nr:hypothetical protein [Planctomycetia bacterium]
MPIEFHCTQCQALLRVPDDAGGRQTRCPKCSATLTIPYPAVAGGEMPILQPASPGSGYGPPPPQSLNPYASPESSGAPFAPQGGDPSNIPVEAGAILSRSWEIFKVHWGLCVVAFLILIGVQMGLQFVQRIFQALGEATRESAVVVAIGVMVGIASWAVQQWLNVGQAIFQLRVARGATPDLGDLFKGGPFLVRGICVTLLIGLLVVVLVAVLIGVPAAVGGAIGGRDAAGMAALAGVAVAFIPLIYVSLLFSQSFFLIVDRDLGVFEALQESVTLTRGHRGTIFLVWLLAAVINLGGMLACCLGILASVPLTMLMFGVTYVAMAAQQNRV